MGEEHRGLKESFQDMANGGVFGSEPRREESQIRSDPG